MGNQQSDPVKDEMLQFILRATTAAFPGVDKIVQTVLGSPTPDRPLARELRVSIRSFQLPQSESPVELVSAGLGRYMPGLDPSDQVIMRDDLLTDLLAILTLTVTSPRALVGVLTAALMYNRVLGAYLMQQGYLPPVPRPESE